MTTAPTIDGPRRYALLLAAERELAPRDWAEPLAAACSRRLEAVEAAIRAGGGLLAEALTPAAAQRAAAALAELGVACLVVPEAELVAAPALELVAAREDAAGLTVGEPDGRQRRWRWSRLLLVDAWCDGEGPAVALVFDAATPRALRPSGGSPVELVQRHAARRAEVLTAGARRLAEGGRPPRRSPAEQAAWLRWRAQLARCGGPSLGGVESFSGSARGENAS